jgi:HK97 family phage portal protein
MRFVQRGLQGFKAAVQGGYGGSRTSYGRGLMGGRDGIDYRAEAGAKIDNSIVYAALQKATLAFQEAAIVTKRPTGGGKYKVIEDHPITLLLRQPVPWYAGRDLRAFWLTAEFLAGASYSFKHRSSSGKLIGLEYLPVSTVLPVSIPGSGNFIDYYQLSLQGSPSRKPPSEIFRTRWHTPNPLSPALAISPLEAVLPEIAMDNRAAKYEAAILRNGGKAHILAPRGLDKNGNPLTFDTTQRAQFVQAMDEMAGGDNAGSMTVLPYPMEVQEIGWKPSDLNLGPTRDLSEERICAAIGAPMSWLGMGSGLASDSNKATREVVQEQVLFDFIIPHLQRLAEQLTEGLVPELGEEGDIVEFDLRTIAAYRMYLRKQAAMGVISTGGPVETVNEFRHSVGQDPIEGGDLLRDGNMSVTEQRPFKDSTL